MDEQRTSLPVETLKEGCGPFWTQKSPVKDFYLSLIRSVALYSDYILDQLSELRLATGIDTICSEFQYRRLLYLVEAGEFVDGKWKFKFPKNVVAVGKISNTAEITDQSVVIDNDLFTISDGELFISRDLFSLEDARKVVIDGVEYAVWWLIDAKRSNDYVYRNFGHILGLDYGSGEDFEAVVRALWSLMLTKRMGNSILVIEAVLHNIPFSRFDSEIVEQVSATPTGYKVVTDKCTYTFDLPMRPGVSPGQKLSWGTPLIKDFFLATFHNGKVDDRIDCVYVPVELCTVYRTQSYSYLENNSPLYLEDSDNLLLESGLSRYGDVFSWSGDHLILNNEEVDVELNPGENGIEVKFALDGDPDDVERFWNLVRQAETILGTTLFELWVENLGYIPLKVNPLSFFAKHVIRNACAVVFPSYITTFQSLPERIDYRKFLPGWVFLRATAAEDVIRAPSDIFGWQKLVNEYPEPIFSSSVPCIAIVIEADKDNSGNVYVGGQDAQNIMLEPGESVEIEINDASLVYVRGTQHDRVYGHVLR